MIYIKFINHFHLSSPDLEIIHPFLTSKTHLYKINCAIWKSTHCNISRAQFLVSSITINTCNCIFDRMSFHLSILFILYYCTCLLNKFSQSPQTGLKFCVVNFLLISASIILYCMNFSGGKWVYQSSSGGGDLVSEPKKCKVERL